MGEATRAVQGYPTQVWIPTETTPLTRGIVGLVHARTGKIDQPGVFFMPGNRIDKLFTPGSQMQIAEISPGVRRRLRIPDAVLWANHGGPCEARGAEYHRLPEDVMGNVVSMLVGSGSPAVISDELLHTKVSFRGPFDYVLPQEPLKPGQRPLLRVMNPHLFEQ